MCKGEVAYLRLTPKAHNDMYHTSSLSLIRSPEEKAQILADVGPDIYIKMTVTNIKRDPKCGQHASWPEKLKFYERVRLTGRELSEQQEWSNAKSLYARCIGIFRNVSKQQRELLTESESHQRDEILNLMNLNAALCSLKRDLFKDAIKHAQEALSYQAKNPKAYYRMYCGHKGLNDLDKAKENLEMAI